MYNKVLAINKSAPQQLVGRPTHIIPELTDPHVQIYVASMEVFLSSYPGLEVDLWSKFLCIEVRAELWIMVEN